MLKSMTVFLAVHWLLNRVDESSVAETIFLILENILESSRSEQF
ncbi:MAG: hypothetical protein M2R45_04538 [Verrucomicrobia subdivision 3 bacterium]|nr:hypothetical protein [Limisphaerales bacterium]MCS1416823.1 hypothetical protein [Limisphaerales bacterium]